MPNFSKRSQERLATCHPELQRLFNEVIKQMDCTILEGHRGEEAQNKAYQDGFSKVEWPDGKHNKTPSLAVDVMPWPVDWQDIERIKFFASYVKVMAKHLGISISHGGDWKKFKDYPHYELTKTGD